MRNQMISVDHKRQYCAGCADSNDDVKKLIKEAHDRKKLVITNNNLDMIDKVCTCCGELITTIPVSQFNYEVHAELTLSFSVDMRVQSSTEAQYLLAESIRENKNHFIIGNALSDAFEDNSCMYDNFILYEDATYKVELPTNVS
jgi:hypothetical protein